jgi:enamine deaminase RidA (YjgF/YER057c/UK114 family)
LEGTRVSLVDSIHWAPLGVDLTMPIAATDDRVHRLSRPDDQINPDDGSTVLRRVGGPEADELYFLCRPECGTTDVAAQAEAVYRAMLELLASEGASLATLASETLFVSDIRRDLEVILDTRRKVLEEAEPGPCRPVTAVIGQPPLSHGASLELSALAVIPHRQQSRSATEVSSTPVCGCEACSRVPARLVRVGEQTHAYAGNIYGSGEDAFEQTYAMFCSGEELLREAGMSFHEVVRTWIYLRDMDRDYADFNRARREFFRSRGIELLPASTAVGGEPSADAHDVSMRLYAVKSPEPLTVEVMSTPTLNEAWMYGSDFSRGLKTEDANKITLHVSGTASIDEAGRTVHVDDFEAQAERMLVNISSLLEAHGASYRDLVSAVAYLKNAGDAPLLRAIFHEHGFEGFPCTLVEAPLCRPDLLCETEAVAVLSLPGLASQQ